MDDKKIVSLLESKPEFLNNIMKIESEEEVKKEFLKEGIELTLEEVKCIKELVSMSINHKGKVEDEEIDKVVGGLNLKGITKNQAKKILAASVVVAIGIGGAVVISKNIKNNNGKGRKSIRRHNSCDTIKPPSLFDEYNTPVN